MKTLILFATKHGATEEIAQRIASRMDGTITHDLKQSGIPSIAEFDCVIIGSSLYAGSIRKEAKAFLTQNDGALFGKKLGLYLCGMDASSEKTAFNANFPSELLQAATATAFLGGIFDPKKAGGFERFIMKIAAKHKDYTDTIDDVKIQKFVDTLKS